MLSLIGIPLSGLTLGIDSALGRVIESTAETTKAPVSALVWWIIPIAALVGGLSYAYWVTRLKSKYENQTERSVGRFRKFQQSFDQDSSNQNSSQTKSQE